jgi:hypothetical protein
MEAEDLERCQVGRERRSAPRRRGWRHNVFQPTPPHLVGQRGRDN